MFPLLLVALGLGGLYLWSRSTSAPPAPPAPQGTPGTGVRLGLATVAAPQTPQVATIGDLAKIVDEVERAANYPCGDAAPPADAANRRARLLMWQQMAGLPQTGCFDVATYNSMKPVLGRNPLPTPCPCGGPGGTDS